MQRLFTLLLIALTTLSCEMIDEKLDDLLDKRDWVVFAEGTELTVDVPSKQTVLNYKFESTLDWEVTTESEWLEIDPTSGKAGKDIKIQIKVLHNKDKEGRTGYVDLTLSNSESYRITVNQAGEGEENDDIIVDIPNNEIWYTSTDGEIVEPYSGEYNNNADAPTTFGVNIVSNTYKDGKGVIEFDGDVTKIGERAFNYCTSLTSVTIPDSVTEIGYCAFENCSSLTSVIIHDSVTVIGDSAFAACTSLTSVTIPYSVTSIGVWAFANCTSLTSVTIGNSVTAIGDFAFQKCTSLTSVTIPSSVTEIGVAAFQECTSLTSFYGKFASVDNRCLIVNGELVAFAPAGLTEYTIPDSVTEIGEWAFVYCTSLTNITIPDSITEIGRSAFAYCYSLTSFYGKFASVDNRCLIVNGKLIAFAIGCGATEYTIPDSVTSIGYMAFCYCTSLTNITIPDSVTTIGDYAFFWCTSLTSVTIPDSVTEIGWHAFYACTSLASVTIPDSVTTIGLWAFGWCESLTSVFCKPTTPPAALEGWYAFYNNAPDRKIYVPAESYYDYICAEGWRDYADSIVGEGDIVAGDIPNNEIWYTSTDGEIVKPYSVEYNNNADALTTFGANIVSNTYVDGKGVIEFDGDVTEIGNSAFYDCSSLTSVTIPDSVTSIGEWAFYWCTSLTSVTIGNSVTLIGENAFYACHSLTSVTIPDSVTEIGDSAFSHCSSLTSFYGKFASVDNRCLIANGKLIAFAPAGLTEYTIPGSVTEIGYAAFNAGYSLTSITIPDSVTEIGEGTFNGCYSLTSFYGKFASVDNRCLIVNGELVAFAPAGLTEYTIPDSVTKIGDYAFAYCASLASVTIPDSVTEIGEWAFAGCSLTSVTIPDSVTLIGDYAFHSCYSLTNITIPDSVTTIGEEVFYYCDSLTSITIPDSVTEIGVGAFEYCTSLTSITIPDSVTTIGDYAFFYCTSLTSVTIPDSVTKIGDFAFRGCSSLTSVTIGNGVTSIGNSAFYKCSSLTSVTIPDSVTLFGNYAFYNCTSLASVTIGNSVTSIGNYAFAGCTSLTNVYCKPTTPPTGGSSMFFNNASGRKIYVPMKSVEAYKSASYEWRNYASYIVGYNF